MTRSCSCHWCVMACKIHPGVFMPGEAEKAADLLGMPWPEFRERFLIIEFWEAGPDEPERIYYWSPRKGDVDNDIRIASYTGYFQHAPCVFLNAHDRCSIHAAKPSECRETLSCEGAVTIEESGKMKVKNAWKAIGNPLKEVVHRLRATGGY